MAAEKFSTTDMQLLSLPANIKKEGSEGGVRERGKGGAEFTARRRGVLSQLQPESV